MTYCGCANNGRQGKWYRHMRRCLKVVCIDICFVFLSVAKISALSCHICAKMILRRGTAEYFEEPIRRCVLCNKMFCSAHGRSPLGYDLDAKEGLCEMNHLILQKAPW